MEIYSLENSLFEMSQLSLGNDFTNKKDCLKKIFKNIIQNIYCDPISKSDLLLVHSCEYIEKIYSKNLANVLNDVFEFDRYSRVKINLKIATDVRDRMLQEVQAVSMLSKKSIENQQDVFYIGGGMHHAERNSGYGFCLFADVAIAIIKMRNELKAKKFWIIDLDAHYGNGNAEIFKDDKNVKILNIFMKDGWPIGDLQNISKNDIDIAVGINEETKYIEFLKNGLEQLLLEKYSFEDGSSSPDQVFIIAGSDPYEKDELESSRNLKLTLEQMLQRDILVYSFIKNLEKRNNRLSPQVYLMAGGYGEYAHLPYVQFLNFVSNS